MISCVFVSGSFSSREIKLTERAIATCRATTPDAEIIVVETFDPTIIYECDKIIRLHRVHFNYNRCLNIANDYAKYEIIGFFNNDVEFENGWWTFMKITIPKSSSFSASPHSRFTQHRNKLKANTGLHFGYEIGVNLCGWAIVTNKTTLQTIGGFCEAIDFWYSDNAYADQLQRANISHFCNTESIVNHVGGGSKTLNGIPSKTRLQLTHEQEKKYLLWRESLPKR